MDKEDNSPQPVSNRDRSPLLTTSGLTHPHLHHQGWVYRVAQARCKACSPALVTSGPAFLSPSSGVGGGVIFPRLCLRRDGSPIFTTSGASLPTPRLTGLVPLCCPWEVQGLISLGLPLGSGTALPLALGTDGWGQGASLPRPCHQIGNEGWLVKPSPPPPTT